MTDLYDARLRRILDVLEALGDALDFDRNTHLQEAYEAALLANPLPADMLKNSYQILRPLFSRANVLEVADTQVGLGYLNGWVRQTLTDGRELRVRAFGPRVLHIPAGNGGLVSAVTILRSVITRCDTIIKAPSNDPLTAVAIARTLADVAPGPPDHQAPRGRVLEGRRHGRRGEVVPARAHRKDRRLGRFRVGQARHPLHPAGAGDDRARPEAQRDDHRASGVRRRRDDARSRARRRRRHRRCQPGGLRQRPRHLCDERHRPDGHRQRQQAWRDDLRGANWSARVHQHPAAAARAASFTSTSRRHG